MMIATINQEPIAYKTLFFALYTKYFIQSSQQTYDLGTIFNLEGKEVLALRN